MKKTILLLILIPLLPLGVYSQCTPDTVNCKDVLTPGQICPEVLPDGYLGLNYSHTVTILPPSSATLNNITVNIVKIRIDTVTNLPPGIVYETNATEMFPGTAYCVLISGIPTMAGEYMLSISVIPYIKVFDEIVAMPPVVNDTTVKMTIQESSALNSLPVYPFQAIENRPNPFTKTTEIGYVIDESAEVSLIVYNNLGLPLYSESMQAKAGRNFFRFTGESLGAGYYIYSIANKQDVYTGKMVKTR